MQDEQTKSDEDSEIMVQGKDYKVCVILSASRLRFRFIYPAVPALAPMLIMW
jgi:hypothetical protein